MFRYRTYTTNMYRHIPSGGGGGGCPLIWNKLAHVLVEPRSFFAQTLSNKNASITERTCIYTQSNFNKQTYMYQYCKEILTKFKDPPNDNPCSQDKMNTCSEV